MSDASAFRILDAAWSLGIRAFDTAEAYGVAASRLRAWIDARGNAASLEVITKCSIGAPDESVRTLEERARAALSRFRGVSRLVLLSHGPVEEARWLAILSASAAHNAVAGQSVYSAVEVSAACALRGTQRLQVPGNVLDRRAVRARRNSPVRLDVRSVYLQGVLLDDSKVADERAPGSARAVAAVQAAADELGTGLAPLLIAGMLEAIEPGDRLLIGVDDASELEVLPRAFEIPSDTVRKFQKRVERLADDPASRSLLDPRTWPTERAR